MEKSEPSVKAGSVNHEVGGRKSAGRRCSSAMPLSRTRLNASRCVSCGPVRTRLPRSLAISSSSRFLFVPCGLQDGNSNEVAGGGGSLGTVSSFWWAATTGPIS